jgi:hypothetical protein
MKVITNTATRLWRASLVSVVREVATRPFSFRLFLEACWGIASKTSVVFSTATLLAERRGISVKWG